VGLESHGEPRLPRLGYPVTSLCEALKARPAEIRACLRGRLAPGRTQELHQELLKLGVVASCPALHIVPELATRTTPHALGARRSLWADAT
jgi:hypothetical protein